MTRRSLVRTLARLIVRDSARDLARCVAARQERAVSARLYSTRDRDVLGTTKAAPTTLDTSRGQTARRARDDQQSA